MKIPKNIIFLDIETTGLDCRRHSIIEAGFVSPGSADYCGFWRPRPGAQIESAALAVNGQTLDTLDTRSTAWREGMVKFFAALQKACPRRAILCGVNPVRVDWMFLHHAWRQLYPDKMGWFPLSHRVLDLHALGVALAIIRGINVPDGGFSSDDLSALAGIAAEAKPHSAMTGAVWTQALCVALFEQLAGAGLDNLSLPEA